MIAERYLLEAQADIQKQSKLKLLELSKLENMLSKNEEFAKLNQQAKSLIFAIAKLEFENKNADTEKRELESVTNALAQKFPEHAKLSRPNCSICQDSGVVKGGFCKCVENLAKQNLLQKSGLIDCCDLKNLNKDVYDEQKMQVFDFLVKWCEKFPNALKQNILLQGKTGVGKTVLAKAAGKQLLSNGAETKFVTAFELNEEFKTDRISLEGNMATLSKYFNADVLIIDDLGSEPKYKNVTENYLYLLLSHRLDKKLPTIITTNLLLESIEEVYGQRVFSRICSKNDCYIVKLEGKDLRLKI